MEMKQIFDWLRDYTQGMLERREQMIGWTKNDNDKIRYENENHFIKHTMLPIINEAEAKWESDCCVWKYRSPASYAEAHKRWELISDVRDWWKFCPYCGKPIKISEVE